MLTPSNALSDSVQTATVTSAPFIDCSDITVTPVKVPFTPLKTTLLASLTSANFDGATAKVGDAVDAVLFQDPVDGKTKLRIPEPLGGWNWITTGVTALPQTIYGIKVTSSTIAFLGCQRLAADVILTTTGQGFGVGDVIINLEDVNLTQVIP